MRALALTGLIAGTLAVGLAPPAAPPEMGALQLTLPGQVEAGTPTVARLIADGPDGTPVVMLVVDGLGATRLAGTLQSGTAALSLPERAVDTAGRVTVVVAAGTRTATAVLVVDPGPVVEPVVPLLGARSIVADGADRAMVVAIPEDRYGNPQPDDAVVAFSIRRENGDRAAWASPVTGGVAWSWIPSGLEAGRTLVAAGSGSTPGPAAHLQEVPGSPARVELQAGRRQLPADGQSLVVVETGELTDRNGNRLLDGTAVVFTSTGPGGTRSLATSATVSGRAATIIQAPEVPGTMTVRAAAGGMVSDPLTITYLPTVAVTDLLLAFSFIDEALVVTVGPITGPERTYVPDGTRVTATGDGVSEDCLTIDGRCRLVLAPDFSGQVRISAAGRETVTSIGSRS